MVKFVRPTSAQLKRERILKERIRMASRGLSDVNAVTRTRSHKQIDEAQKQLRKLNNKIFGKK